MIFQTRTINYFISFLMNMVVPKKLIINSYTQVSLKAELSKSKQAGVTLLLAILVLGTMLAIALSLATVLFVEIRTSGDLDRSEGAIYAATGIGEQSLFYLKRQVCTDPTCDMLATATTFAYDNGISLSAPPVVSSTTTPVFHDMIPANGSFALANVYNFCSDLATSTGCNFAAATVQYLSNSGNNNLSDYLTADMCQFDPSGDIPNLYGTSTPCSDPTFNGYDGGPSYWITGGLNVEMGLPGNSLGYASATSWSLLDQDAQELILFNTSPDNIYVSISTFGPGSTTPFGLPLSGETSVNINAVNGTASRKIQVIVPAGNASGTPQ
jgi:hypothetical protein